MRIEIGSDVVCPWCYIGKRRFEQAFATFHARDEVEVVYRSFELEPRAPEQGAESVVEALGRKYGGGPVAGRWMVDQVTRTAADAGLVVDFADATRSRTMDAHRVLHLALAEGGPTLQSRLKEAFLATYFTEARPIGDHAVLRQAARSAGLDPVRVDQVLSSDEFADDVLRDVEQARAYGISGVPFYVVDEKLGISGAQPVEVFARALEQAWASSQPQLHVVAGVPTRGPADADPVICGPGGCAF